jgi:hypothetical protein
LNVEGSLSEAFSKAKHKFHELHFNFERIEIIKVSILDFLVVEEISAMIG